jgi:hypothetical protein
LHERSARYFIAAIVAHQKIVAQEINGNPEKQTASQKHNAVINWKTVCRLVGYSPPLDSIRYSNPEINQ